MSRMEKYWKKAIECHEKEMTDIEAIQEVWNIMMPPATTKQLAAIIGAIYADSYWVKVQMNSNILSASLQKAQGWDKRTCDDAAKNAFSKWYGLMVRNDFSDVGNIPKVGTVTNSPDTLCNEGGALARSTMLNQWNSYFYNQAVVGKNYCYCRAQAINIPVAIKADATAKMFFSEPALNPPPQTWQVMYTEDQSTTSKLYGMEEDAPIGEGDRIASGSFIFEPPAKKHYCMISVAQTKFFQNDPLHEGGNFNSSTWRLYNGAGGWHNINPQLEGETLLKYYNEDASSEQFVVCANCVNVPLGTKISLESKEANFNAVKSEVHKNYQLLSTSGFVVPPNFEGNLSVKIDTPDNIALPPNAFVEVVLKWVLKYDHKSYCDVNEQMDFSIKNQQEIEKPLGNYIITGKYPEE